MQAQAQIVITVSMEGQVGVRLAGPMFGDSPAREAMAMGVMEMAKDAIKAGITAEQKDQGSGLVLPNGPLPAMRGR